MLTKAGFLWSVLSVNPIFNKHARTLLICGVSSDVRDIKRQVLKQINQRDAIGSPFGGIEFNQNWSVYFSE